MIQRKHYILTILLLALIIVPADVFAENSLFPGEDKIAGVFAHMGAFIFGFAALLFKYALQFLVFEIGNHMTSELGTVVNVVWTIMRDMCNLIFIFTFLYIGMKLVLTSISISNARAVLIKIILAALLVNFSLFFAKAVIDIANIATVAIYGLFSDGSTIDVAKSISESLGLVNWFTDDPTEMKELTLTNGFMMMIFFIIAAACFVTASIILVVRYVVLLLGMIMSPIVLVFYLIPNVPFLGGIANKAQGKFGVFLSSAFYPAVFLFLVYISVRITGSFTEAPAFDEALLNSTPNAVKTIVVYAIGIALLFTALKAASMVSNSAANMTMGLSRKAAGAATFGAAAFAGRYAGSKAGAAIQNSELLRNSRLNRTALGRTVTTSIIGAGKKVSEGSYDVRNTKLYQKAAGAAGVPVGSGWGQTKLGYAAIREEKIEKAKAETQRQAMILAGVDQEKQKEKEEKAEKEFNEARQKRKDAQQYEKDLKNRYGNTTDAAKLQELADAKKATEEAFVKERDTSIEHKKIQNEHKEKINTALYGTLDARRRIQNAETAARMPEAESQRAALTTQRADIVARMATAAPAQRVEMQASIEGIDKMVQEQEKIIESAKKAASDAVDAEYKKKADAAKANMAALQTALSSTTISSSKRQELTLQLEEQKRESEKYVDHKEIKERIEHAKARGDTAAAASLESELERRKSQKETDTAAMLRDAKKIALEMKQREGGYAGAMANAGIGQDILNIATLGAAGSAATHRESAERLRDKNKPKPESASNTPTGAPLAPASTTAPTSTPASTPTSTPTSSPAPTSPPITTAPVLPVTTQNTQAAQTPVPPLPPAASSIPTAGATGNPNNSATWSLVPQQTPPSTTPAANQTPYAVGAGNPSNPPAVNQAPQQTPHLTPPPSLSAQPPHS